MGGICYYRDWVPAFAGMTVVSSGSFANGERVSQYRSLWDCRTSQ